MNYTELDSDILLLADSNNEHRTKERLREMSAAELRLLRIALARLDEWLDDLALERMKDRRETK